jgi:hypothetical protein
MRRHLVPLAPFLVQPHPPALTPGVVVLNAHGDDGADAAKNSRNRFAAASPASATIAGTTIEAATARKICGALALGSKRPASDV